MEPKRPWEDIVSGYTRADLTFTSDKLVAIAGIAQQFAERYSHTYIAGMWKEHFDIGAFLWKTSLCKLRPPFRGAPTWSWASIDGDFSPKYVTRLKDDTFDVSVLVNLDIEAPNQALCIFGEVQKAILSLSGVILFPKYRLEAEGKKLNILGFDFISGSYDQYESTTYMLKRSENIYGELDVPVTKQDQIVLLCLHGIRVQYEKTFSEGLILRRAHGQSEMYERVGYFSLFRNAFKCREVPGSVEQPVNSYVQIPQKITKTCWEYDSKKIIPDLDAVGDDKPVELKSQNGQDLFVDRSRPHWKDPAFSPGE
jgi:hypothetical protein